ncbi:protein Wnt-4 isoform X2 [Periplaneta americana]
MRSVLIDASILAKTYCQDQFRYDPWNCSATHYNISFFDGGKVHRETALMYAMYSASLTHIVARACADGSLKRCWCAEQEKPEDTRRMWRWGICGENYNNGRRFTRRLFRRRNVRSDKLLYALVRHDTNVGIQAVGQMKSICKCHGVSGSCTTKTCWKRLRPFKETSEQLRGSYYKAQLQVPSNRASPRRRSKRPAPKGTLVYLEKSPDFCPATRGRVCRDPDNCGTLCCCRGYVSLSVLETETCNCRWVSRSCKLSCSECPVMRDVYICK